ncbi:MAG: hypothetical protein FWD35_04030 [Oscillospiraceae bacterium]|nr:hypothetical protein [Oscillospiraceae bacterium]
MLNEIIVGVKNALICEFGEGDFDIFTESPDGGSSSPSSGGGKSTVKPCLFVTSRIPRSGSVRERRFSNRQLLGNRYIKTAGLCIEHRPAAVRVNPSAKSLPGNLQEDNNAVLERLFVCLEYIRLKDGSLVRGENMQGEYDGNVLNFFVSYDVFVYLSTEAEENPMLMEALEINNHY